MESPMQTKNVLRLTGCYRPLVVPTLQSATAWLRAWWQRRQTMKMLAALSAEQMLDCGIKPPEPTVPIFEVPTELMQKLLVMHRPLI